MEAAGDHPQHLGIPAGLRVELEVKSPKPRDQLDGRDAHRTRNDGSASCGEQRSPRAANPNASSTALGLWGAYSITTLSM